MERSTLFFFTAWWLAIPILFYAVARVRIIQVFVERYISYAVEAEALLFAAAGYLVFRSWAVRLWVIVAVVIASPLEMKRSWTTGTDELKPLLRIIAAESKSSNSLPPVFFRSELPESDGWQLAKRAKERWPSVCTVYRVSDAESTATLTVSLHRRGETLHIHGTEFRPSKPTGSNLYHEGRDLEPLGDR